MTPCCLDQTEAWARGECRHNSVDGECCPDFACCHPHLFTNDRAERIAQLNKLRARFGLPPRTDA